jgi:hypothetical protein
MTRPKKGRRIERRSQDGTCDEGGKSFSCRVYAIAHDESWAAEGIVASADAQGATLTGLRILSFPARTRPPFEDENYRVAWVGSGYRVQRKKDGAFVTQPTPSEKLAERDLAGMYPQRV